MLKEKVSILKEKLFNKEEGNNKKRIENLVIFLIILIVTVVMINYIWNGETKEKNEEYLERKVLASDDKENNNTTFTNSIENRLENILSKIKGVGEVNVLITYSQTSTVMPMYSEDTSQTLTKETDTNGGTRTVSETVNKKDVVYEENSNTKVPVTQSTIEPVIEGAIITAKGASKSEIKASIIQAVEAATGLAAHKIQVFEME